MAMDKLPFGLTYSQALLGIGIIVLSIIAIMLTIMLVLDKLNVKSFSFKTGFTFYQDGDIKKSRITRRKKTVKRKAT